MIAGILLYIIFKVSPVSCLVDYSSIDKEIKSANYCEVDSDCKVLGLGGSYIEFGCYHFINKNVDEESLINKIDKYSNKCTRIIDDCMPAPKPICINNKCTSNN